MKYFVLLLILIGFSGTAFAQYMGNISNQSLEYTSPIVRLTDENIILPPLKQIKDGIQFHNVKCNVGLELVYKNDHKTSACVILTTKIELMVRGWADDMRVISGCLGERYDMCYPSDKNEYRKALYEYYFGDDNDLPSSGAFEFARLHSINGCKEKPQICLGEFDNGTKTRVACDYPIHSCGVIPFDINDYKTIEENEN